MRYAGTREVFKLDGNSALALDDASDTVWFVGIDPEISVIPEGVARFDTQPVDASTVGSMVGRQDESLMRGDRDGVTDDRGLRLGTRAGTALGTTEGALEAGRVEGRNEIRVAWDVAASVGSELGSPVLE